MNKMLKQVSGIRPTFFKGGGYGFEGGGKTLTTVYWMIGLYRYLKDKKQEINGIAFFDTEQGSDFVADIFENFKVPFFPHKSRSLKELHAFMVECANEKTILIIDSLTHIYKDALSSYLRTLKSGRQFISIPDWQIIKTEWATKFANLYQDLDLHIMWLARAKNIIEDVIDEAASEEQNREVFRAQTVGVGAKTETESAFEPNFLVNFYKSYQGKSSGYSINCRIDKDRSRKTDRKEFLLLDIDEQLNDEKAYTRDWAFIKNHVEFLDLGGKRTQMSTSDSTELFERDQKYQDNYRRKQVALETIKANHDVLFNTRTEQGKKDRYAANEQLFGSQSPKQIESLHPNVLERAAEVVNRLHILVDAENYTWNDTKTLKEKLIVLMQEYDAEIKNAKKLNNGIGEKESDDDLPF